MARCLVILEVSQKQAYIFGSKKLAGNVFRSDCIRYVTEEDFLRTAYPQYDPDTNLIYTGGGHTVLCFDSKAEADAFARAVSYLAFTRYDGMELFVKRMECSDDQKLGESVKALMKRTEQKKSLRASSFRRKGTGLEAPKGKEAKPPKDDPALEASVSRDKNCYRKKHPTDLKELVGNENFFAVVHIDGNSMGKKSQAVTDSCNGDWETDRKKLREFSEEVDTIFQMTLKETVLMLEEEQLSGNLEQLGFPAASIFHPIRPLIAAGDDICFLTPGSIGLECAAYFLKMLDLRAGQCKANGDMPQFKYSACAGVALVHTKYPFHKAYDLSEALCSSAKKYAAQLNESAEREQGKELEQETSALDWHIEFGQVKSLSDIRSDYRCADSGSGTAEDPVRTMTLRPVSVAGEVGEPHRTSLFLRRLFHLLQDNENKFARSKVKGMRPALKQGLEETEQYIKRTGLAELTKLAFDAETDNAVVATYKNQGRTRQQFIDNTDPKTGVVTSHNLYFDAIELLDHMLLLEGAAEPKTRLPQHAPSQGKEEQP